MKKYMVLSVVSLLLVLAFCIAVPTVYSLDAGERSAAAPQANADIGVVNGENDLVYPQVMTAFALPTNSSVLQDSPDADDSVPVIPIVGLALSGGYIFLSVLHTVYTGRNEQSAKKALPEER